MNLFSSPDFASARYIWSDTTGQGLGRVVLFRREFSLEKEPSEAWLHLFADTRYRLVINGETLGHGPARFHVSHPEFDSWDIAPYLHMGQNVVAVLVHSLGCQIFSSDKSIGGLIAWGQISIEGDDTGGGESNAARSLSLATGPDWKVHETQAYLRDTMPLNFALGPFEYLNALELPAAWDQIESHSTHWQQASLLEQQQHWGHLEPRSIPLLDESAVEPHLLNTFSPVIDVDTQVASLRYRAGVREPLQSSSFSLLTWIYSPCEQTVDIGVSWGRFWLNCEEIKPRSRPDLVWRGDCSANLKAGWNSWLVIERMVGGAGEFAMCWPKAAGLLVNARRENEGSPSFIATDCGQEWLRDTQNLGRETLSTKIEATTEQLEPVAGEARMPSPFAERAWEKLKPCEPVGDYERCGSASSKVWLFDFETSVLGRPRIEFTAATGTTVDVLYTERLNAGVADHRTQSLRMGERYIAREGQQSWQLLHPRGMRYLELIVRGDLSQFQLHSVQLTKAKVPTQDIGEFECSAPALNQIWKIGRDTLAACMEDGYIDCPWRERGIYTGDVLVQFYSNLATFGDRSLMRRSLLQLFETQDENSGELAPSSHGLPAGRHPDYSALALVGLWHYWARTADVGFVNQLRPRIEKLLHGLQAIEVAGLNLVDVTGRAAYVDVSFLDTGGINCASNCFHQQAFVYGARLLRLLGDENASTAWEQHAEEVASAIRGAFWDEKTGSFLDRRPLDKPETLASGLGNTLVLLYGIAEPHQQTIALHEVVARAINNKRTEVPLRNSDFHFSPYSSFYVLELLYENAHATIAQRYMKDNWEPMLEAGAVTWWEYFLDEASLCHAWSSCPTHYLSSRVLGVQYATAGEPDEIIIAPQPGTLQWARGVYPHPRGPIKVEWRVNQCGLDLSYEVPDGVKVVRCESELKAT